MKSGVRIGALLVLLLLFAPILLALGQDGTLVFPIWWAVAYVGFWAGFPASKQPSVPALAVLTGSMAYLLALISYHGGAVVGLNLHAAILVIGMFWLFIAQSKAAALALIVMQAIVLVTGAVALSQFDFSTAFVSRSATAGTLGALFASVFSHVFAIYFLTVFALRKPAAPEVAPAT